MAEEKEIDLSIFYKLLDPKNQFVETVKNEESAKDAEDRLKNEMLNAIKRGTGVKSVRFVSDKPLTMAERDRKRPKGFQV